MRTVILDPLAPETGPLIARRRRLGLDTFDEVWEGGYHMVPGPHPRHARVQVALATLLAPHARRAGLIDLGPFNLGSSGDFRVPDLGYHRVLPDALYVPTAAIVVEVLSTGDESYEKFAFYADHAVDEILIADPDAQTVAWWSLAGGRYRAVPGSDLLGISAHALTASIDWP